MLCSIRRINLSFHRNRTTICSTKETELAREIKQTIQLKPLTPIAGTNLFLNTQYKWHDHTRPGCYATWFKETYHDYSGRLKGVSIVCNNRDQEWYNTPDASWIFERTSGAHSKKEYNGTVKIRNVGADETLETWNSRGVWWLGLGKYDADKKRDMWNVRTAGSNKNHMQLEIDNWFLAQVSAKNHRFYVYLKEGKTAGFPYSFVSALDLEAKMYDFQFTRPLDEVISQHTSQKGLIDSYEINNNSPGQISRKVIVSEKIRDEFSWGLSQSLSSFAKVSGSTGVPYLASAEVEVGFEVDLGAHQDWTSSVEKSFELSYDVTVPPHTKVKISAWYDLIKGISMDYTATTEITGKTTRITVYDDLVDETPAAGKMILSQLDYSKFEGKIVEIKEHSVIVQIKGTLVASIGVRGQLSVNGSTVEKSDVPK